MTGDKLRGGKINERNMERALLQGLLSSLGISGEMQPAKSVRGSFPFAFSSCKAGIFSSLCSAQEKLFSLSLGLQVDPVISEAEGKNCHLPVAFSRFVGIGFLIF